MTHTTRTKRVLIVAATLGVTLAGAVGTASAGSESGNCAWNMVNAHTWPGGMETAMTANLNGNGNGVPDGTHGMFGAITHSCRL